MNELIKTAPVEAMPLPTETRTRSMETAIDDIMVKAQTAIELISTYVDKPYYEQLTQLKPYPCTESDISTIADTVWLYRISRLAYEKDNRSFSKKLGNVLSAVGMCGGTLIMRIDYNPVETVVYFGVKDQQHKTSITTLKDTLYNSFQGNFHGSELNDVGYDDLCANMRGYEDNAFSYNCITSISTMAHQSDNGSSLGGLESILDAAGEQPFSLLIIGDPMEKADQLAIKSMYENLATQLSKFISITFSQQEGSSIADGTNTAVSDAIAIGETITINKNSSETDMTSDNETHRDNPNKKEPVKDAIQTAATLLSLLNGDMMGIWAINSLRQITRERPDELVDLAKSDQHSTTHSTGKAKADSQNKTTTHQQGTNHTFTTNLGFSAQYSLTNHTAKGLYDRIVNYLNWIDNNANYGMFNVCAYVLSADASTNMMVASQYASMMNGERMARTYGINTWSNSEGRELRRYLSRFSHPVFEHPALGPVQSTVSVSGAELSHNFLLPQKSIGNLSVLHYEPFGRNVVSRQSAGENGSIYMGCIHHLGGDIPFGQVPVHLDSLSRHTFVGGANGTGKSTALFTLLNKVYKRGIPFMVIEPAKGEYRRVFGNTKGIKTYSPMRLPGTLPLQLNLFWFRDGIDVNEHVEKLVEIFCSCWPMYAAMPQVLREAIFNAYEHCGWNLDTSENPYGRIFPHIRDVCVEIESIIRSSKFSAEVKGNYIGSLLARLQSLDKGIYKRIFSSGDMGDEKLFEQSVILDISRPDSDEVKALIMGLVVVRHFEYCATDKPFGDILRHLTVLEEAHTLLASKSTSSEGADMGNKSIEMISRCIAELGGFGQGFIIADQAPGLLDRSVIRNTNTKLIFRLPDMNDCELTGKSMGLTTEQYVELSRLNRGVCAIHQISWEEAVLCHIQPELPSSDVEPAQYVEQPIITATREDYLKCLLTPYSAIGKRVEVDTTCYDSARMWASDADYSSAQRLTLLKAITPQMGSGWRQVVEAIEVLGIEPYEGDRSNLVDWTEQAIEALSPILTERTLVLTLIEALLDIEQRRKHAFDGFHDRWFDAVRNERT